VAAAKSPKPILVKDWAKTIKPRRARKSSKSLVLHMREFALPKDYRKSVSCEVDKRKGVVRVSIQTRSVGQHFFPPNTKTVSLRAERRVGDKMAIHTTGMLPDHLALSSFPAKLARELRVRHLYEANMSHSNIMEAFLHHANLHDTDLSNSNLWRADLTDANLVRANLRGTDLTDAKFAGADLTDADLSGAKIKGTDFSGTKFRSKAALARAVGVSKGQPIFLDSSGS
jgi:Pentapeptide repeats (8 copies)